MITSKKGWVRVALGLAVGGTAAALGPIQMAVGTYSYGPTLTVQRIGSGGGTVEGEGIACGRDCSETFSPGATVALTASPGARSVFQRWGGACSGRGACEVSMSDSTKVTAAFSLLELSVADVRTKEGTRPDRRRAAFTVALSSPADHAVAVRYRTAAGSALERRDFAGVSGLLVFEPGETTGRVTVGLRPDRRAEENEGFFLVLSAPEGAALSRARAAATIVNDD